MSMTLADIPQLPLDLPPGTDPYPILKDLRAKGPLAKAEMGIVIALRQRHLDIIMSDNTRQLETETKVLQGITSGPLFEFTKAAMLFANGEEHRRRRAPVQRTFAFKLMDAMRPKAAALAAELVGDRVNQGPVDFVGEIAAQIPARIIADILGIPRADLPIFLQWIADTAEALGFIDVERRPQIEASLTAFADYVTKLLEDRRRAPKDDFLSDYVAQTARDGELSEIEIRTQVVGLILAGSDTTRGSLCMTLAQLLSHPSQWRAFCEDPDTLKRGVVDEGLRFEPVVTGIPRVAVKDFEVDGVLIPAGTVVSLSFLSALRDEEVFADPDRFDIFRKDHPRWHMIFGAGAHRCVGEALARAEMEETLATIARLAPNTKLVGNFPILKPGAIRQIDRMEVAFA
ncbi:MAG: cytochrome P450 [Alphaproteobacteria bacterium]|nr:cytochrome P450 [Alphaproteobacteria bacterium]